MLTAFELRIGNKCTYGAHGVVVVSEIKETGKVRVKHTERHSLDMGYVSSLLSEDDLTGIPLTSEVLEKCGFINGIIHSGFTQITVFEFSTISQGVFKGEYFITLSGSIPHQLNRRIKYLHELQNVFHALTGEELNVQL